MKMKLTLFATLALCLFLSTSICAQIANGSFEDGASINEFNTSGFKSIFANESGIDLWSVGLIGVDLVDSSLWQASDGVRSVDLNGTVFNGDGSVGEAPGSLSQDLLTEK